MSEAAREQRQCACVACGHQIDLKDFTSELSFHEFEVDGLCQDCKDAIFSEQSAQQMTLWAEDG